MKKMNFKFPKLNFKKTNNGRPKKKKTWIEILNIVLCSVLILGVLGGTATILVFKYWIDTAPEMDMSELKNAESTRFFAADGTLIGNIGDFTQQDTRYIEFPQSLIDAFVAVEDSRFFEHNGFDLPRFTKAIIENLKTLNFDQGGSTLTMQLTRAAWLVFDKSVPRKVREIYMAIKLEQNLSKRDIIELYLNKINFGASTSRGIQSAAQYYFNKDVSELTLSESAYLAGVVNRPYGFNAYAELEAGTTRRNVVLNLMVQHGYITAEEATLAKNIKLEDMLNDANDNINVTNAKYPAYINTVIEEVMRVTGKDPFKTPMDIYTYMDIEVQEEIERVLADPANFPANNELLEAVIVTMNNQTGEVIGVGSGRDPSNIVFKGHNWATSMRKQPGSSIKPILSYALAFEYLGYATSHVVEDKPIYLRGTSKLLRNADGKFRGQVTFKDAMGRSLNIPAYELLEQISDTISYPRVVEYLQNLGFANVTVENFDLGYAIGGSNFYVTPMEMAGAYAVIMNGGYYIEPHTIEFIEYKNDAAKEYRYVARTQVLSEQAAFLTADLMSSNVSGSYVNYMQILGNLGYPVYAKTGTTDWGDSGLQYGIPRRAGKDKWMVANTTQFTNVVWVGYDQAVKDKDTYFTSAINSMNIPGRLNAAILKKLASIYGNPTAIQRPDGISEITHVLAVYPYAAPIEGMNPAWVVTGLIKSENNSLVPFTGEALEVLTTFDASSSSAGGLTKTFTITLGGYPGGTGSYDDVEYDISLYNKSGNVVVAATGTRLFSPSWVLGAEYGARIIVNGVTVADNRYYTNSFTMSADFQNDATVQVCGYYARGNGSQKSNEICKTFDFSSSSINVPMFRTIEELNSFKATYGLTFTINAQNAATVSEIGKTISGGVDIRGSNKTLTELKAIAAVTFHQDYTLALPGGTSGTAKAFVQSFGGSYSSSLNDGDTITSYVIGGVTYNPGDSIKLSQLANVTGVGVSKTVSISQSGTNLNSTVSGFSSPTYQWYADGIAVGGANGTSFSPADSGHSYYLVVSEGGASIQSNIIAIP